MTALENAAASKVAAHLADRLDEAGIGYAIGGALALGVWGVPRTTVDVDLNVFVGDDELSRLFEALERAGALFNREDAARDVARIGMLTAQIGRTRIDIFVAHHPLHAEFERRRVKVDHPDIGGRYYLSATDVALAKLIYHRPKDVIDLERLFAVQGGRLDVAVIRRWLTSIVPAGDERIALLDRLSRGGG